MELAEIKRELETYLGHPISEALFMKSLTAYQSARHGPAALGGYAALGYVSSFKHAIGDEYEEKLFSFFCGRNEYSENIRKQLIPYRFNIEFMPTMLKMAYWETYHNEPYYAYCERWYELFIWYFLKIGIPEEGVAGIIRKHPVPVAMVKRYGKTTGLVPEIVAQNILDRRHDPKSM